MPGIGLDIFEMLRILYGWWDQNPMVACKVLNMIEIYRARPNTCYLQWAGNLYIAAVKSVRTHRKHTKQASQSQLSNALLYIKEEKRKLLCNEKYYMDGIPMKNGNDVHNDQNPK